MTKVLLLIIALLTFFISCQSNPKNHYPAYYRMYNQVLRFEKDDKIQEAWDLFQEAEQLVDFIPVQHLLKARSFAIQINDCEIAQAYFQKAVNNGFEYETFSFSSDDCPEISNSSVQPIKFDAQYREMLKSIYESDQGIRNGSISENMQKVDSTNITTLLSLIKEKGYPNSRMIGERAASNAFIILLHFDSDIGNKKLKPILKEAYQKGMISPENYAWVIDRRRNWGPDKLDPYYYQLPTQKYFELSQTEIEEIDNRRDSLGLRPLSEMNISKTESGGISIQF